MRSPPRDGSLRQPAALVPLHCVGPIGAIALKNKKTIIVLQPKPEVSRPAFRTPRMDVYAIRKASDCWPKELDSVYLGFFNGERAAKAEPNYRYKSPYMDGCLPCTMACGGMGGGYWHCRYIHTVGTSRGHGYAAELVRGLESHLGVPVGMISNNSDGQALMASLGKRNVDEDDDARYEWATEFDPKRPTWNERELAAEPDEEVQDDNGQTGDNL